MGFDPAFKADGLDWFSACDNLEDMSDWFSKDDLIELGEQGYHLYKFTVDTTRSLNGHVVFTRQHVRGSEIIPLWVLDESYL